MARLTQCASLSAVDEAGQMLAALADFMELVASNISAIYEALNTTRNALSE